jgi:hypothetical protein
MNNLKTVLFVGLNPSRGNEYFNDPTITRCINFAKDLGFGSMLFGNLFSRISPTPDVIRHDVTLANHPLHDLYLKTMFEVADTVVFCWGSWNFIQDRKKYMEWMAIELSKSPQCFGMNLDRNPKHPLYLKSDVQLKSYFNGNANS